MESLWFKINALRKRRFVKLGIPFFVLVIGGSFYLEQFSKLRYQFGKNTNQVDPAELKKYGIEVRDRSEITLEAEYEKMKKLDIDNWEPVRIPRPWDETIISD